MKRIGITGGMGCGKSTVVAEFRQLGVHAFVADQVASAYYAEPDFQAEVCALFGDGLRMADGTIDKRRLSSIVFSNPQSLARLNALVHPRVMRDFEAFCRLYAADDYVLFESAILYEHGFDRQMDAVVGVYLELEERLQRLAVRDHADRDSLMARIANQWPAETVLERADYVILTYEGYPRHRQVAYVDGQLRASR